MRLMQAGSDGNRFLLFRKVINFYQGCDMWGKVLGRGAQLCLLPSALLLLGAVFFLSFPLWPSKAGSGCAQLSEGLCALFTTCGIFCGAHCSTWAQCHRGVRSWLWLLVEQALELPKNICTWR